MHILVLRDWDLQMNKPWESCESRTFNQLIFLKIYMLELPRGKSGANAIPMWCSEIWLTS